MGIVYDVAKLAGTVAVVGVVAYIGLQALGKTNVVSDGFGAIVNSLGLSYDYPGDWWLLW